MADLVLLETDYHGKFGIAELYRETIVAPIIECQRLDIDCSDILVLIDDNSTGTAEFCARATILPDMMADVIYQLTSHRYEILLRLSQAYLRNLEPAQITYYIYDALRHVMRDTEKGKYVINREHDIQIWSEVLPYVSRNQVIPDLSEVKIYGELGEGSNGTASD